MSEGRGSRQQLREVTQVSRQPLQCCPSPTRASATRPDPSFRCTWKEEQTGLPRSRLFRSKVSGLQTAAVEGPGGETGLVVGFQAAAIPSRGPVACPSATWG